MDGCLFCKIVKREIPAQIVFEDDRALAFRDINPAAPTHVLVIPKAHVASINDLLPEHDAELGYLFRVAAVVAKAEGIEAKGYRTVMNCGVDAGQSVFHVHLHLVGGRPLGWPPFPRS